LEKTFLMIKPDAVGRGLIGEILRRTENYGFRIVGLNMARLSRSQAEKFYGVHREKDFFDKLVKFVSSGPVVAVLLERRNAVRKLRQIVGATDPKEAEEGTIRHEWGTDVTQNAVHASDSTRSFRFESKFFF
jgi:nucleoside-diphosphate kinase